MFRTYICEYLHKKGIISKKEMLDMAFVEKDDFADEISLVTGISVNDFNALILDFQRDMGISDDALAAIRSDNLDDIISSIATYGKNADTHYNKLTKLALKTICVHSNGHIIFKPINAIESYDFEKLCTVEILGEVNLSLCLAGNGDSLLPIASGFAERAFDQINPEALDSVCELLNSICGMYISDTRQKQLDVELMTPKIFHNKKMVSGDFIYRVPLLAENHEIDLLVTESYGGSINKFS